MPNGPGGEHAVAASASESQGGLKRSAIGWGAAAVIGAVFLSPALGLYANIGTVVGTSGNVAPAVWLVAGLLAMLNATNYAMVSSRMPAAGSAFTWTWNLMRPKVGGLIGWVMLGYYLTITLTLPLLFGLFFNAFLNALSVPTGYGTWAIGVILCSALVAVPAYRNIEVGTKTALILLLFEAGVVLVLALTLLVVRGKEGLLTAAPLNPGNATSSSSFFLALVFGVFAYTGFDAVSTVAEETHTPRAKLPQATIAAVALVGVFWLIVTYALSFALPLKEVQDAIASNLTPVAPMAKAVWGSGEIIVDFTGMTAAAAVYLAAAMSTSRVVYAQGRDGILPNFVARLNPRHRTPWNALHIIFVVAIVGTLAGAAVVGILNFFAWAASATMFFGLIMYSATAVGNFLVHRRDGGGRWFTTIVVPVLAVLVNAYLFYKFYFDVLWHQGFALGQSITITCVAFVIIGAGYIAVLAKRKPEVFTKDSYYLDEVAG
ncbi:APC family permease [Sphaerisporangium sp. NPDC088356]|uniref:APC family permease n=1 Tax=Sphaerisporangium sp. NPDC088356 TaxID=3154871 RepID=UPI00342D7CD8